MPSIMFLKSSSGKVEIVLKAVSKPSSLSYQRRELLVWYNPKTLFIPILNGTISCSFLIVFIELAMLTISLDIIDLVSLSSFFSNSIALPALVSLSYHLLCNKIPISHFKHNNIIDFFEINSINLYICNITNIRERFV